MRTRINARAASCINTRAELLQMHEFFLFHLGIFLVITMSIDRTPKCAKCTVMKYRYLE